MGTPRLRPFVPWRSWPQDSPGTRVTWIARQPPDDDQPGPIVRLPNDPLNERDRIAALANAVAEPGGAVTFWPGTAVQSIAPDTNTGGWQLELLGIHAGPLQCDRLVANVGYRPDTRIFAELHVAVCVATECVERQWAGEPWSSTSGSQNCAERAAPPRGTPLPRARGQEPRTPARIPVFGRTASDSRSVHRARRPPGA